MPANLSAYLSAELIDTGKCDPESWCDVFGEKPARPECLNLAHLIVGQLCPRMSLTCIASAISNVADFRIPTQVENDVVVLIAVAMTPIDLRRWTRRNERLQDKTMHAELLSLSA